MVDHARLRALAVESENADGHFLRARFGLAMEGPAIIALLDEVAALRAENDAGIAAVMRLTTERDEALAQREQTSREFDKMWGAAVKATTERDAAQHQCLDSTRKALAINVAAEAERDTLVALLRDCRKELADILEWAFVERAPIRPQERTSMRRVVARIDAARGDKP